MSSRRRMNRSIDYTKLFLEPPEKNYKNLQIDRESISYITTPHNAIIVSWILRSNLDGNDLHKLTIFDGTSGVGGDTIVFGHVFGSVIGCELDKNRFSMLQNNINVYDLSNVIVMNDDCLKLMFDLNFLDIVYLDPPWGGKSYKKEDNLTLSIGDMSVETIVNDLLDPEKSRSELKLIVLKLPKNYDIKHLYDTTKNAKRETTLLMYELEKMLIMVFKIINHKSMIINN
jgi:tRNA G10  N-methylase Trm11